MSKELVDLLGKKFIARRDVKAKQSPDGAWYPERAPWKRSDLEAHIAGTASWGHYMLDSESKCKLFSFDVDLVKDVSPNPEDRAKPPEFMCPEGHLHAGSPREVFASGSSLSSHLISELRGVADGLAARAARMYDVPTAISFSGSKGLHVYCFTGYTPAVDVRSAALDVINSTGVFEPKKGNNFFRHMYAYKNVEIEVFPKQDTIEDKELGNLMRLPLGRHAKSGREAFLLDPLAPADMLVATDPVAMLEKGINWNG